MKDLEVYAFPSGKDKIDWFTDNMFKGQKSAQECAEIANSVVDVILSQGRLNFKELQNNPFRNLEDKRLK